MANKAIMPFEDYQAACDAVREQTGTSDLIKSGDMASMIRSIEGNGTGSKIVVQTEEPTDTSVL